MLAAAAALLAWSSTATGDYTVELQPAVEALLQGDVGEFLARAPIYGPSVLPRAPFLFTANAAGAGTIGVYLAGVFACLLVVALLAWVVDARLCALGREPLVRAAVVIAVLLAPWLLRAGALGHPEEAMTGALCAIAVLAALDGRVTWAGLALGAAVAFKPWALLAAGPVLCAARNGRARLLVWALGVCVVLELPFLLERPGGARSTAEAAAKTPNIFHPHQLFWLLHEHVTSARTGATGDRGPQLLRDWAHPLIVATGIPATLAFAWRLRARAVSRVDALALLAFLLLLRSVLDPWNTIYYAIPAVLALAIWEGLTKEGLPWRALLVSGLGYLSFRVAPNHLSDDWQSATYLIWMVPAVVVLGLEAFGLRRWGDRQATSSATAERTADAST
ncbi:unannotated protein [freshwater metagenome]|uniref:Unannotated protein n=1 Tax=freshwater metagenome TaxID=449393 RepID=A0A6J7HY26_9ZZZZ